MRLTLLSCLLLVSVLVGAQSTGLYFDRTTVTAVANATDTDVKAEARIVNPSNARVAARWIREVNALPGGWASAICDTNQCYTPRVDSADFSIGADEDAPIQPHVYPDGTAGDAQVTVRVIDIANRANNAVATFSFSPGSSSVRSSYPTRSARLYPNPGNEEFRVMSDEPLAEVKLTNMLGKVVRRYPAYLQVFDVRDLPDGIYLATLVGQDGRVVKTLRYSKRQVMP